MPGPAPLLDLEKRAEVARLYYQEGQTQRQIAERFGVSHPTILRCLRRGRVPNSTPPDTPSPEVIQVYRRAVFRSAAAVQLAALLRAKRERLYGGTAGMTEEQRVNYRFFRKSKKLSVDEARALILQEAA